MIFLFFWLEGGVLEGGLNLNKIFFFFGRGVGMEGGGLE